MSEKVYLDGLIRKEDFIVNSETLLMNTTMTQTISLQYLKKDNIFFQLIRKPDFQRETNEWDSDKICILINCFLKGDLVPAIILWSSPSNLIFVIDGAHRLSALAAWINDDYGDGPLSLALYDNDIPEENLKAARKTREQVEKQIGRYATWDQKLQSFSPTSLDSSDIAVLKQMASGSLQVQWVNGDVNKAEQSFYRINQQQSILNDLEIELIKSRYKPMTIATRSIINSAKGYKYWNKFGDDSASEIEDLAKEIYDLLYYPLYKSPLKTIDLPIAYKSSYNQATPVLYDLIKIVKEKDYLNDETDGKDTISLLKTIKKYLQLFNSNHPGSLGLHPIIYCYSQDGNFKVASLYATLEFVKLLDEKKKKREFIQIRKSFEEFIQRYDYVVQAIIRKARQAITAKQTLVQLYDEIMKELLIVNDVDEAYRKVKTKLKLNYIADKDIADETFGNDEFSKAQKNSIFIRTAINQSIVCPICGCLVHSKAISVDHIERKEDGGTNNPINGQVTHPFCNTGFKN